MADLQLVLARFEVGLDDSSAPFLAELRAAGALDDKDWQMVLNFLEEALRFLSRPNPTAGSNSTGGLLLDLDADPRNANWLRIVAAQRKAYHRLPMWAAMWLMAIGGHRRGPGFWRTVSRIATRMKFPRFKRPGKK